MNGCKDGKKKEKKGEPDEDDDGDNLVVFSR